MTAETIHTCSYYCERPECIKRQRDELRDRMEAALASAQQQGQAVALPKLRRTHPDYSREEVQWVFGYNAALDDVMRLNKNTAPPPSAEAVAWLRMTPDGTPDWAEDCIGSDDRFLDPELASDGYYLQPLYTVPQQSAAVDGLAARLVDELDGLVGESYGVSGLHLNGDVAPWDELLPGGRFERLSSLDELRAALAAQQQGGRADGFAANRQEGG